MAPSRLFAGAIALFMMQTTLATDTDQVLKIAAETQGLIVHLGCGNGRSTTTIGQGKATIVHAIDVSAANVDATRKLLMQQKLYGKVTVARLIGNRLPYIDNLVNLVVAEAPGTITDAEIKRVLCPNGIAWINRGGTWSQLVKPRPPPIDDWTHYLHDPSNNAVANDSVVGPPRRMQWVGGPRYSRHHDRMSSFDAMVSAGGRVFYIFDEATPISIFAPPKWKLIARDAFNGTILWKRDIGNWHPHLFRLKSGPADLPRRVVATDKLVFATLGVDQPVVALNATTGETVHTYPATKGAEEILHENGILYLRVNPKAGPRELQNLRVLPLKHDLGPRRAMAVDVATGKVLWRLDTPILPGSLTVGASAVYIHDGKNLIALGKADGKARWRTPHIAGAGVKSLPTYTMPTIVAHGDVVLVSGLAIEPPKPPKNTSAKGKKKKKPKHPPIKAVICGFNAATGKKLWQQPAPPSGYQAPLDVFVINGLVWTGNMKGNTPGEVVGLDLHTGERKVVFNPQVKTFWFHHRCHRGKAAGNYMLVSRTGIEFIDTQKKSWDVNSWIRGACLYGIMPANGLIYAPQHPCACYLESKLNGLNAVAPAGATPRVPADLPPRLERGPAYDAMRERRGPAASAQSWPTYRADNRRSGRAATAVTANVTQRWQARLGGALTAPTIANNKAFVAAIDLHTLYAIDMSSGKTAWTYTAGGKIDSPPTIDHGRVLFGSADGYVYCLRAADGALAWRFRAAPMDQRTMVYEQLQSVWPVHGSVLVRGNEVWAVAGRSMFLDSGLRLWRIDAATGKEISCTVLNDTEEGTGKKVQDYISWLNMPTASPDVLSCDDRHVFMRSQAYALDGKRLPLEKYARKGTGGGGAPFAPPPFQKKELVHLLSPTGFLDDAYWHRSYWVYGSQFYSGWCGYPTTGKAVPAGKILVFDDTTVYGYGRDKKYYRWTTPIEHELFATSKAFTEAMKEGKPSPRTGWSQRLPFMVRAMVLTDDLLFAAGPPDLLDEEQVAKTFAQPQEKKKLVAYTAALTGRNGGILRAVSKTTGKKLAEYKLDAPPVFNGMAAAQKKLVVVTTDGSILCYGPSAD